MLLTVGEVFKLEKDTPEATVSKIRPHAPIEVELDAMVSALTNSVNQTPDQVIALCMGLMARCTEIKVSLVRSSGRDRGAKLFKSQQLQPVMDLIEFEFKAASRLIEVARIDMELSR